MNDYLWRAAGEKDEEIEKLERVLGTLRFTAKPLDLTATDSAAASSTRLRVTPTFVPVMRRAWLVPVTMAATIVLASTLALVVWRTGRMNMVGRDAVVAHVEESAGIKGNAPSPLNLTNGDSVNGVGASPPGDKSFHNDSGFTTLAPVVRHTSHRSNSSERVTRSVVPRTRKSDAPTKNFLLASEAANSSSIAQNKTRASTPEQAAEDLRLAFGITTGSLEQARKQIQARLPSPLFPTTKIKDLR